MHTTVGKLNFAIACEPIVDHGKTVVPFNITRTFKELIEDRVHNILGSGDKARYCDFIGKLTGDQSFIVCEVNIDLYKHRGARG